MKFLTALCLLGLAAAASAVPAGEARYTDRYDNVNLSEILANKRLLVPYIKCILDQGKCSPDGKELKSHIKEAIENYCAKCTDAQRDGAKRVIAHMINNEQDYWNQMKAKYDPTGKYAAKYEEELKAVTRG